MWFHRPLPDKGVSRLQKAKILITPKKMRGDTRLIKQRSLVAWWLTLERSGN